MEEIGHVVLNKLDVPLLERRSLNPLSPPLLLLRNSLLEEKKTIVLIRNSVLD